MSGDPVAEARGIVETYLERSMVPDPEGAAEFVGDEFPAGVHRRAADGGAG